MYQTMLRIRMFEERVTREFRKGDMPGFVHTYIGAEAVSTGVCLHLDDDDYNIQLYQQIEIQIGSILDTLLDGLGTPKGN